MTVRDRLESAGHALGVVLVLAAVALAVVVAVPGLVGAEASYVVYSDSMSPTIEAGDLVVVTSADPASLSEGDIITFRTDGGRVTHRIVSVEESDGGLRFRTKGDANEAPDREPVRPSQVVGTVWITIPLVGHVVAFAGTDIGLLVFVVAPAVVLVVTEVYSLYSDATADHDDGEGPPK